MQPTSKKISNLLIKNRWYFLSGLILATLAFSIFIPGLGIDNSLEVWFLKDDPALKNYYEFKELYGNDEALMVLVKPDGDVLNKEFVSRIYSLSNNFTEHPLIRRVLSISKAPYINADNDSLIVEDMVSKNPADNYSRKKLEKRLRSNPLWNKLLFNKDKSGVLILIEPVDSEEYDTKRPELLDCVRNSLKGLNYRMAGMGVVYDELNRISLNDSAIFTSISYIVLILALLIFVRRFSIIVSATLTIIFSILIFLGIMGLFKQSFNMVSVILPSLIIILCLADIIHIYTHYQKFQPGKDRLKRTLSYILIPCLFTSVTTGIGFSSLAASPMAVLKSFGIFAAVGVMLEYFVSVIVTSFILSRKGKGMEDAPGAAQGGSKKNDFLDHIILKVIGFNKKNYKYIVLAGGILVIAGIISITQLTVDTYSINFLLDNNRVKQDSKFIEKDYGNYLPLEVRLIPDSKFHVTDPDFLKGLSAVQERLDGFPDIEKSVSIADVVKQLNKVLTDNREGSCKIPERNDTIAQQLLLYEMDRDNDLSSFITEDYEEARLTVRIPMCSSSEMAKYISTVKKELNAKFGDSAKFVFGGYIPLYVKMMDYIIDSQVKSFTIAFIVIFLVMALLFRSLSVILIGIVPNLLPVLLTLGFMGVANINLDIATVTIAAIAIGISVDDTIHFIFMYKKKRSEGFSIKEAVEYTLATSGKAIIITSLLLVTGYLVLVLASVKSIIFMGLLIAVTMVSALLCDLFLLPSLLLLSGKDKA